MDTIPEQDYLQSNAFISADELVSGICLREGDMQKINYPLYLSILKEEYIRMNLSTIKETKRLLIRLNPDLKCINVPSDYIIFHSIGIINGHGKFEPLILNDQIRTDDFIDIHGSSVCGCTCGCDNPDCSNVKNYELIESQVVAEMPDGSLKTFNSYIRKKLLTDGSLVTEIGEPARVYVNNVWVDTKIAISQELACKLELKTCGCIKPTSANSEQISATCDAVDFAYEAGNCNHLHPIDHRFYKVNAIGNRIHFPPHFPYDKVLLRYFADTKTKDLRIPILCARLMRSALKLEYSKYTEKKMVDFWKQELREANMEFAGNIARLKLDDFYAHVLGKFNVL
jgi:hypothetical protein